MGFLVVAVVLSMTVSCVQCPSNDQPVNQVRCRFQPCRTRSLRVPTAHVFLHSDRRDRFPEIMSRIPAERNVSLRLTGWGMSLMTDIFRDDNG